MTAVVHSTQHHLLLSNLLLYYETNKNSEEFKFMSKTDIEQWFLQQVNSSRLEQNQKHITVDEIREQLKQPFGSTN